MAKYKSVALGFLVVLSLIGLSLSHGHSHDDHDDHGHGHGHDEPPSFKWSRAANEDPILEEQDIPEEDIIDLPPQYGKEKPTGGHGHAHGGHGHAHGGHGHSHGGHGHSHGPPQREPTPEERAKHRAKLHREWDDDEEEEVSDQERFNLWVNALGSTLAISMAPFIILFFLNVDNSPEKSGLLKVLLAFASGGLLGDAFLHLIPHAIMAQDGHGHSHGGGNDHGHTHGHSHGGEGGHDPHDLTIGLGVLGGILAFLVVEKVVRLLQGDSGHGHSHGAPKKAEDKKEKKSKDEDKTKSPKKGKKKDKDSDAEDEKEEKKPKKKEDKKEEEPQEEVQVAGYLNLFADFFHNFTDGLAIGASFLAGNSIGIMTTFTILFHEIPHEIGDYAILIQSGVKPFKAKCLQLLTAVGAFCGCVVSLLWSGADQAASAYILPFTAGGFIYIATVSVIPELLEGKSTAKQSLAEITALVVGVYMMVVITWYE